MVLEPSPVLGREPARLVVDRVKCVALPERPLAALLKYLLAPPVMVQDK